MSKAIRTRQGRWGFLAAWLAAMALPAWAGGSDAEAASPPTRVELTTRETPLGLTLRAS